MSSEGLVRARMQALAKAMREESHPPMFSETEDGKTGLPPLQISDDFETSAPQKEDAPQEATVVPFPKTDPIQ